MKESQRVKELEEKWIYTLHGELHYSCAAIVEFCTISLETAINSFEPNEVESARIELADGAWITII